PRPSSCLHKIFQIGKLRGPEFSVVREPPIDKLERPGIELIEMVAALGRLQHEVGLAQQTKMLGYRRPRDRKSARNLAGRSAAVAQEIEHRAAGGIGEGSKGQVGGTCNRLVSHNV